MHTHYTEVSFSLKCPASGSGDSVLLNYVADNQPFNDKQGQTFLRAGPLVVLEVNKKGL